MPLHCADYQGGQAGAMLVPSNSKVHPSCLKLLSGILWPYASNASSVVGASLKDTRSLSTAELGRKAGGFDDASDTPVLTVDPNWIWSK